LPGDLPRLPSRRAPLTLRGELRARLVRDDARARPFGERSDRSGLTALPLFLRRRNLAPRDCSRALRIPLRLALPQDGSDDRGVTTTPPARLALVRDLREFPARHALAAGHLRVNPRPHGRGKLSRSRLTEPPARLHGRHVLRTRVRRAVHRTVPPGQCQPRRHLPARHGRADVRTLTPGRDVPDVAAPDVLDRLTRADVLRNHVDRALFPLYGLEFDRPRARRAFDRPGSLAAAHHLARPGAAGFRRAPLVSRRGVPG